MKKTMWLLESELAFELQFSCLAIKCLHVPLLVPRLAVPADVTGSLVYTADSIVSLEYPPTPPSPTTFVERRDQLLPAEQRLLRVITFAVYNTEIALVQYLHLYCTIYIGTEGSNRAHSGSFL